MYNKKFKLNVQLSAIALSGLFLLSACGGSETVSTNLLGSAFKGPIDNALVNVMDSDENLLASGSTSKGNFDLAGFNLPADDEAVFIETRNGQYDDEATGQVVSPAETGLMTVFTVADLKAVIGQGQTVAMTPETTVMAKLVKKLLADGMSAEQAIAQAKDLIQKELIDGTNPAQGIPGDELLITGDLSGALPADQKEALARNRAISFSYETQTKNLSPEQVFELIENTASDLEDGKLDGLDSNGQRLTLQDRDGQELDLSTQDRKAQYGLARTRLMTNTINRLASGNLSDAEKAELRLLGINTDFFDQMAAVNQEAETKTAENLLAGNLPAFNHLPVLSDEDGDDTDNNATYTLSATDNVSVTINAPGTSWTTPMMRYNGMQLPPVIKAKRNDAMTLNLLNDLSSETTIHWHGFKIPGDQDGGPDYPVAASSSMQYSFTMLQPAAPLWFHPHPDMKTGEQVYRGLAGVFLLSDAISQQLEDNKELPASAYDIPLLIQDRRFSDEVSGVRELLYKTSPMDNNGMLGKDILVNGAVLPQLEVETRQYRFRLYNTSNARTYNFALSNGASFKVIGTDGGLLPEPVEVDQITLGAAERAEIVIDFGSYTAGEKVMLISKAFSGSNMMAMGNMPAGMEGMQGMGDSGMGGSSMSGMGDSGMPAMDMSNGFNGMRMDIMRFDVSTDVTDDVTLYSALPAEADINTQRLTAADATKTRNFVMSMAMGDMGGDMNGGAQGGMAGMNFVINGKAFDMSRVDELIELAQGDTEIWSIKNMTPMAHPFHAHAIQWQILDRNGVAASGTDLGWKDTVLVQPGETVNFIGRFDPAINTGDYMYHCHILEHEDNGMMGVFRIQ